MAAGSRAYVRRGQYPPVFAAWLAIQRGPCCQRWRSFANFYADVGERPTWRHLLIRDDPTGALSQAMPDGRLRSGIDGGDLTCLA
jgi:hypothetical protein